MGRKPKVQTRLPQDTYENLKQYCEDNNLSEADAVRRAVENEYDELDIIPDGGRIHRSTHPWIDPLITISMRASEAALGLLLLAVFTIAVPTGAIDWFGVALSAETTGLFLSLFTILACTSFTLLGLSALALVPLEFLMHPSEAPIRRYFYNGEIEDGRVVA